MEQELQKICDVRDGTHESPTYVLEGYPLVTSKNIIDGKLNIDNVNFISKEDYLKINQRSKVDNGDILMPMIGTIGKPIVVNKQYDFAIKNVALIKFYENSLVEGKYVKYVLDSELFSNYIEKENRGGTQKFLSLGNIRKFTFSVPNINIQRKIVQVLDTAQSLIDNRKQQIEACDELIKSRFVEMFGDWNIKNDYPVIHFEECTFNMLKGPFGSDMKKDLYVSKGDDTYKVYIQINAIQKNQDLGEYYISKDYFDSKIYRFEVKPKDYIITCDGTLGKYIRLNEKMERGVISSSLLRIRLNEEKIVPRFFECMWELYMLKEITKHARNACLVHLPSAKVIGEFEIPLPSMEEQNQFTTFVQQVDKQKSVLQQSLSELDGNFNSLIQRAFKGELFPED